jgi:hypothetical protein
MSKKYELIYRTMEKLDQDWTYPSCPPPNSIAIQNSKTVLKHFTDCDFYPHIGPSTVEGVCLSLCNKDHYADIECCNDGEILALVSDRKSKPEIWDVDMSDIGTSVQKIINFIQEV